MLRLFHVARRRFSLLSEVAASRRGYCDKDFYELLDERRQLKKSSRPPYLKRPLGDETLRQIVELRDLQERINTFEQRLKVLNEAEKKELQSLLNERESIRRVSCSSGSKSRGNLQRKATSKLMDEVGELRSKAAIGRISMRESKTPQNRNEHDVRLPVEKEKNDV